MHQGRIALLGFLFAGVLVATAVSTASAQAQTARRVRIIDMRGRIYEGEMEELPDGYRVTPADGITVTIKKSQIRKIIPLEPEADSGTKPGTPDEKSEAAGLVRREVSDEEIAEILGDSGIASEDVVEVPDLAAPLVTNKESVEEMKRIAGRKATTLETKHFVLVYTSERDVARKLASRLESIYQWALRFMDMLEIPKAQPEYRLEIYFFGTHDEYMGYGSTLGGIPPWAAGFYMHGNNRSAFYDANTDPAIVQIHEQLKNANYEDRRRINNILNRRMSFINVTVIQHESAHHVHFNVGIFNRRGDSPTWLVEGMAQMFELPPGETGASLGTTNHYRLAQFQNHWREKNSLPNLRTFLADDKQWNPLEHYPLGWAVTHYLWKTKRAEFAKYMRKMAVREDDVEIAPTQRQQEFEDIFGPSDEKFQEDFHKYMMAIPLRKSALEDLMP